MTRELKSLTGVRGIAALLVVVYHYNLLAKLLGVAGRHGYIWVDLFFILSGYVMTLTYAKRFESGTTPSAYFDFLGKRIGRVYPLYLVLTLTSLFAIRFLGMNPALMLSTKSIFSNLLMIQTWGLSPSFDSPAWSISTEFAAYLLFPALLACVDEKKIGRTILTVCVAFGLIVLAGTRSTLQLQEMLQGQPNRAGILDVFGYATIYPILRCLSGFTLGICAFRLSKLPKVLALVRNPTFAGLITILTVGSLAIRNADFLIVALFAVLVPCLATENNIAAQFCRWMPIYNLGLISYSVYLVHRPLDQVFYERLCTKLAALHAPFVASTARMILLVACLLLATGTYHLIEKPARDWSRRFLGKRSAPPIEQEPSAP